MKISKQINPKLKYEFCELRANALCWCLQDIDERLMDQKNIIPTEEEQRMGIVWELLEGQVRAAVREMIKKGYCTTDSGFWGETGMYQKQFIEGLFTLDLGTVKVLEDQGVYMTNNGRRSSIWFYAENPDFEEIKNTWNEIAALIPDLGHSAKPQVEIEAPVLKRIWVEMERKEKAKTIKTL